MATTPKNQESVVDKATRLSPASQKALISLARSILEKNQQFNDMRNKMDAIDIAYARYKESEKTADGVDVAAGSTGCDVFASDDVVPPIVVSQVDSYVAYLAEVFLSGQPLFPVVSAPARRKYAEQLESVVDDHAIIGGYARQLLLFLRDGCKYNFSAVEAEWDSIEQFSVLQDVLSESGTKLSRAAKKFTRITRLNPRNVIWDWSVNPGDVSEHGDYAGYVTQLSRTKLKRRLNKWSKENKVYNADKAMLSAATNVNPSSPNFHPDPVISKYNVNISSGRNAAPNWDIWFDPGASKSNGRRGLPVLDTLYEEFTLYCRIMPADFGIPAPQPNTPQIWKIVIVNNDHLVYAQRVISAFDYLPILFGQPLEDGLGYQTQSIAEGEIPFQEAANTLFNIRFAAARRAVSDRALYVPDMIKPSDINAKVPAPKIPVQLTALSQKGLGDAYMQIPFDMRGTETTIQDASLIVQFSKELHGVNSPRQGQFQKGNKSVQEWNDTMGGSDGRMRLPALTLECQVFSPLKSIIALNILQYGQDGEVVSSTTGSVLEVKIAELRTALLSFKMADGYTPKSKLASTETITAGMQLIMNSPILQQSFGPMLPSMFIHMMSLNGVKGFEQYDPQYQQQQAALQQQTQNISVNDPQNPLAAINPAAVLPVQQPAAGSLPPV